MYFSADRGRWPEAKTEPSLRIGPLIGYLTTGASMIASINAIVAGAGLTLLAHQLLDSSVIVALLIGTVCAALFLLLFYFYQRYRISDLVSEWEEPRASGRVAS